MATTSVPAYDNYRVPSLGRYLFDELGKYMPEERICGMEWELAYDDATQDALIYVKYKNTDRGAGARVKRPEGKSLAQIAKEAISEEFVAMLLLSKPQPPAAQMEAKV